MFTLINPANIRCKNCQYHGMSVVNNYYRLAFVISFFVIVGIVVFYCYGVSGAMAARLGPGLVLPVLVCYATFTSQYAHSYPKCTSTDLQDLDSKLRE